MPTQDKHPSYTRSRGQINPPTHQPTNSSTQKATSSSTQKLKTPPTHQFATSLT